jgi:hypothetical protein
MVDSKDWLGSSRWQDFFPKGKFEPWNMIVSGERTGTMAGKTWRRIRKCLTNSETVGVSQKEGVYMFYDLNQDDSIYLQSRFSS